MTRLIEWLLVSLIALVLSSAYLLDGPSELDAMRAGAASSHDAQKAADTLIRFAAAASKACGGDNAAYVLIDSSTVQCSTKRGYKIKARLKYRLHAGNIKFWYELDRVERSIEDAFGGYIEQVREASGYVVLLGVA